MTTPALNPDQLLQQTQWLRALAAGLVGPSNADDVVQEAYLQTIDKRPDDANAVHAWMRGVTRNLAKMQIRGSVRRRARERAAARSEAIPSASEATERLELQKLLVDALLRLDEPYRRTVVLRFWEGMTPIEIARAERVSGGTIRVRLHRALEQLREALDDHHGGDRDKWRHALLPIAGAPLGAGTTASVSATGSSGSSTSSISMSWTAIAIPALAITVAVGLTLSWWPRTGVVPPNVDGANGTASVGRDAIDNANATDAAATENAAAPPSTPVASRPAVVRVVDDATGEPVPGAVVETLSQEAWRDHRDAARPAVPLRRHDLEFALSQSEVRTTSDAEGSARLEVAPGYVLARSADRCRVVAVKEAPTADRVLELRLREPLHVKVVDPNGRPAAGIPVVVEEEREGTRWQPRDATVTNVSGAAAFSWALDSMNERDATRGRASVALGILDTNRSREFFEPELDCGRTVTLTLPESGELNLTVDGLPGASEALVWAQCLPVGSGRELHVEESWQDRPTIFLGVTANGRLSFPWCGLDLDVQITALASDDSTKLGTTVIAGPTSDARSIAATATVGATKRWVVGRLVRADGTPWNDQRVELHWTLGDGSVQRDLGQTDEDGRLRKDLTSHGALSSVSFAVPDRGVRGSASIGDLAVGENDLGEIRLDDAGVALAGRVRYVDGTPIAGHRLEIEGWLPRGPHASRTPDGLNGLWKHVHFARGPVTDERGGFELAETEEVAQYEHLRVGPGQGAWIPAAPVAARRGDTNVDLALRRGGGLRAKVIADSRAEQSAVRLAASFDNGSTEVGPRGDGSIHAAGLPPGLVRVKVLVSNLELLDLGSFDLEDGETIDLGTVDVRSRLEMRTVTIRTPDGEPLRSSSVMVGVERQRGGDSPGIARNPRPGEPFVASLQGYATRTTTTDRHGRVELLVPLGRHPLIVAAEGYRLMRAVSDGDIIVKLEPRHRVRVRVIGLDAVPASIERRLSLDPSYRNRDGSTNPLGGAAWITEREPAMSKGAVFELTVPFGGPHSAVLTLIGKGRQEVVWSAGLFEADTVLELVPTADGVSLEIEVDPARVASSLRRMGH